MIFLLLLSLFLLPAPVYTQLEQPLDNKEIINLVNGFRAKSGILPLRYEHRLAESSLAKVNDMIDKIYFGHTNPEGESFSCNIRKVPYRYRYAGEVLAKIQKQDEERVLAVWEKSPAHRRVILDPRYQDIGCASGISKDGLHYLVSCHLGTAK